MSYTPEVPSRQESLWIATAAASQGPWGLAAAGGAVIGGVQLGAELLGGHLTVAGPIASGLIVFLLIGSVGALLGKDRDRARDWAHRHPWRFAIAPAIAAAAVDLPVKLVLSSAGLVGATADAMWAALSVFVIVGLVGMVVGAVRRGS
ncbi:MAG TPA: hypothetical protein VFU43_25305 [Streptosporangiaceae bacterium]|nr:hypothetical protein [Streptosporangiaceae bacterium]